MQGKRVTCASSAQRLAASEVLADLIIPRGVCPDPCSTPCGIRGFGRISPEHWRFLFFGAQRLAASEVLAALRLLKNKVALLCSTPCGIRGFGRRITCRSDGEKNTCSTPCGIRGFGREPPSHAGGGAGVLNALRHQRFWQRLTKSGNAELYTCSTPCGIRGFGRRPCRDGRDGAPVCSTPCGIRGFGRPRHELRALAGAGAQRLAASEVLADVHQQVDSFTPASAQRLAASEVLAALPGERSHSSGLCSTPCGIRGFGSR